VRSESNAAAVKQRAAELGFDAAGITDLSAVPHSAEFTRWLAAGMAGTMSYMHRQKSRRLEPGRILEGATRAIVVTQNYYLADLPPTPGTGFVAKYARGRDYHLVMGEKLEQLSSFVRSLGTSQTRARAFADAGPVPERELAQRAGLGWIGKNTMLIDPRRGSFFFLGTVLTDLPLALDLPFEADRCGSCRRCLDACPTDAFPEERVIDGRRCISYLTIEYRGEIDAALSAQMGDHLFGCDICQDVCPWNQSFAMAASDPALGQDPALARIRLDSVAQISDSEFEDRFGTTAISRTGPGGLRRNAEIVERNSTGTDSCRAV